MSFTCFHSEIAKFAADYLEIQTSQISYGSHILPYSEYGKRKQVNRSTSNTLKMVEEAEFISCIVKTKNPEKSEHILKNTTFSTELIILVTFMKVPTYLFLLR